MDVREAQHQADLETIRRRQRELVDREQRAHEARDAEDRRRTVEHQAQQARLHEAEAAAQRAWSDRLHELERQLAGLSVALNDATGNAVAAAQSGDWPSAGDAQARAIGLESLRNRMDADLANHRRGR